jgi:hypothetical protein
MPDRIIRGHRYTVAQLAMTKTFVLQPRLLPFAAEVGRIVLAAFDVKGDMADKVKEFVTGDDGKIDLKALNSLSIEKFLELDLDLSKIGDMLAQSAVRLAASMSPADLGYLLRRLLQGSSRDGAPLFNDESDAPQPFDTMMLGQTMAVWELLFFSVQVNFPDLFSLGTSEQDAAAVPANS